MQADRPVRSERRSARRSPPRSTTSTRSPGCRRRPPASSTGSASSGWSPGRLALEDARLRPGAGGGRGPGADRDLPRLGARRHRLRRGAARALPRARGSARSRPNLALAVFGGAAPANLGIALDVRGPILSTANSCASGAVALGEALGDLREGRVDAAIAGGCEIPLSPLAFGAFDIIRALSAGHNDDPGDRRPAVRCGSRRLRHGRGRRAARARGRRDRRATRRDPVRRAARLRGDIGRLPHGPAAGRRHARPRAPRRSPSPTPASTPTRSTTSTRTPPRRRSATWPRRGRSRWRSASGRRTVPVSGTKALYGHPLGASGAIEAAICALAIRDGWAPASVNLRRAGSRGRPTSCRACCGTGATGAYRRVLSTSFGFGGLNAALVFGEPAG